MLPQLKIETFAWIGLLALLGFLEMITFTGCMPFASSSVSRVLTPLEPSLQATDENTKQSKKQTRTLSATMDFKLTCSDGTALRPLVDPFANEDIRAVAFVFITTQCPIANAYHPYLRELVSDYESRGVKIYLVHSSTDITQAAAQKHVEEFELNATVLLDPEQKLAREIDAEITPQVFLLNDDGDTIYKGAINNLYAGYGKKRARATEHYLRDAIDQHLAGEPISTSETKAIGCFIAYP